MEKNSLTAPKTQLKKKEREGEPYAFGLLKKYQLFFWENGALS